MSIEDLPRHFETGSVGVSGKHLLMVYPKDDVWQREVQQKFVGELKSLYPDVTGTPVQLLEYTTLLKESYVEAAWYALGAIVLLVFVQFRSFSSVILALIPVGFGFLWCKRVDGLARGPAEPC